MRIVEIEAQNNGSHKNQTIDANVTVSAGWAVIPDDMVCENFPFGDLTVDHGTPPVVTNWTPGEMPVVPVPPEEPETPENEASVWDELDAAYTAGYNEGYQEGVNTAYDNQ